MAAEVARPLSYGRVRDATPEVAALNAPLFRGLIEGMRDDRRRVILDLGPARPETVALFGAGRCRLEIADIAPELEALNAETDAGRLQEAAEALLPPRRTEAVDLVFCWDLLNYLARPALSALARALAERLRPGSLLHALIVSARPQMASTPGLIVPGVDDVLLHFPAPGELRSAPRYTPEDLGRCLPGYAVERVMLLKNGMQEYLFRR
jgi:hypothetical protein